MAYNKYAEIEQKLRKATPEQRAAYIASLEKMLTLNQAEYDQAVKFRPAYAPKGRETSNESGKRAVLQDTTALLEHVKAFLKTSAVTR